MKPVLTILAAALFLVSCGPPEISDQKALREYIEQQIDNPKSYEPVETIAAQFTDLYEQPDISKQLANIENSTGRICGLLESIDIKFRSYLDDSTKAVLFALIQTSCIFEDKEKIRAALMLPRKLTDMATSLKQLEYAIPSNDLQTFLSYTDQFAGAQNRLEKEVKGLHGTLLVLGMDGYGELFTAMESGQVLLHRYRIDEEGKPVLKSGLFRNLGYQIILSLPMEVEKL